VECDIILKWYNGIILMQSEKIFKKSGLLPMTQVVGFD